MIGWDVAMTPTENPRVEAEQHYYNAAHTKLLDLGLEPHLLDPETVVSMLGLIQRHQDRVIEESVPPKTRWRVAQPQLV